jgi:hypothetical protein
MVAQLKRGGTRLTTITSHVIWLECICGRNAPVRVTDLLASTKPPETVADVAERVRCKRCAAKGAKNYWIVYAPATDGAFDAMRGAEQRKDE